MYLAIGTRPDIAYAVGQLSRFNDCFGRIHWNHAIHVVRYLKGTRHLILELGGKHTARLIGFTDSDYANCPDSRKSISSYTFSLKSGLISWMSKKQATVSTSSTESKYIAACFASKEAVWLRALLKAIGFQQDKPSTMMIDNVGAQILTEDSALHQKMKHVDTQYHYVWECVERNRVHFQRVPSKDNIADVFTKALPVTTFERLRSMMGVVFQESSVKEERAVC